MTQTFIPTKSKKYGIRILGGGSVDKEIKNKTEHFFKYKCERKKPNLLSYLCLQFLHTSISPTTKTEKAHAYSEKKPTTLLRKLKMAPKTFY